MRAPYRTRFDPAGNFIVRKPTTVSGRRFERLESFDKTLVSERRLRQMFAQRTLVYDGENPGGQLSAADAAETFRGQRAALAKAVQEKRAREKAEKLKAAEKAAKAAAKGQKPGKGSTEPKKARTPRTPRAPKPTPDPAAAPAPAANTPPPGEHQRETVEGPEAILAARAKVEIPEGWAELPWTDRLKLAAQLSDTPVRNGEEVAKAIEAELARRGNP